jgi:hypothetical protein
MVVTWYNHEWERWTPVPISLRKWTDCNESGSVFRLLDTPRGGLQSPDKKGFRPHGNPSGNRRDCTTSAGTGRQSTRRR